MIATQVFGRTGHQSTRALFGAAAFARVTQDEADRALEVLLSYGVNHIDVAASYGEAELRVGPWMREHRKDFFLATKTEKRTYQEAKEELHRSLERLKVDMIDLWQMHVLVKPEEWEIAMGAGGALEAFIEAREQGLVRFLGVTGHGLITPNIHYHSLERFDFDSVLLPYNFALMQDPEYHSSFDKLQAICKERNVAVQTIKTICRCPWGDRVPTRATWYEPLEAQDAIDHAVHWALGNPQVFINTLADIHLLPNVLDAASRFEARPADDVMLRDVEEYDIASLFTE